jgi:GNAT superfamily N-acetyltransferase
MNDSAENTLAIDIRYSQASQLEMLHTEFSSHTHSKWHHTRHAVQESGEGVYLIAWHGHVPVGHYLLRWNGPDMDPSGKYPYPTPYLESGLTKDAYRRKGVASSIMRAAEGLAREKGFHSIGLAVGARDNPEARRLYEGLGYRDWGQGELTISWEDLNSDNPDGVGSEVCIYMFKNIAGEGS